MTQYLDKYGFSEPQNGMRKLCHDNGELKAAVIIDNDKFLWLLNEWDTVEIENQEHLDKLMKKIS